MPKITSLNHPPLPREAALRACRLVFAVAALSVINLPALPPETLWEKRHRRIAGNVTGPRRARRDVRVTLR
jgi:hypothetical protein